jgi:hypothetical protein
VECRLPADKPQPQARGVCGVSECDTPEPELWRGRVTPRTCARVYVLYVRVLVLVPPPPNIYGRCDGEVYLFCSKDSLKTRAYTFSFYRTSNASLLWACDFLGSYENL